MDKETRDTKMDVKKRTNRHGDGQLEYGQLVGKSDDVERQEGVSDTPIFH